MRIGPTEIDSLYIGSTEVQTVYIGSTEVWSNYLYNTGTDISAGEAAEWTPSSGVITVSRENGNTEIRIDCGAGIGSAIFDLYNYCTPGSNYDIYFDVVSVDAGDAIIAGLYSSGGSGSAMTTTFANSPLGPADTGTQSLTGQVVNAANRYIKFYFDVNEALNINNIKIRAA